MAFTTSTAILAQEASTQFQGSFTKLWNVTATINPASIAAAAEDTGTITVTGVAVGDMIVAYAPGVDLTFSALVNVWVSAANTVTISISNVHASSALDLASSTCKFVIGRPSF